MPRSRRTDLRLDAAALRSMPLPSNVGDDKVTRGTTMVIGGSAQTVGAVLLAGIAALRVGAGRLQIATDAGAVTAGGGRLLLTPNREELDGLAERLDNADNSPSAVAAASGATVATFGTVAAADGRCWADPSPVSGLGTSGAGDVLAGVAGGIGARC